MDLSQLRQRIEQAALAGVFDEAKRAVAARAHDLTLDCFREQRDPHGNAWAPRKDPRGGWSLLDKTGDGINSLTSRPTQTGVLMRITGHMSYHLTGTRHMVARAFWPVRDLGAAWAHEFGAVVDEVLSRAFRRAA